MNKKLIGNSAIIILNLLILKKELSNLPNIFETFNYITEFNIKYYYIIFYLFCLLIVLPVLSIINLITFATTNFIVESLISIKVFKSMMFFHFSSLFYDFNTTFVLLELFIICTRPAYLIIRTPELSRNNLIAHLFNGMLFCNILSYTFYLLGFIHYYIYKKLFEKFGYNYFCSKNFLKKNYSFLLTLIFQIFSYLFVVLRIYITLSKKRSNTMNSSYFDLIMSVFSMKQIYYINYSY